MVQFITHFTEKYSYLDSVDMALKGGCRWIQLRMKDSTPEEIKTMAIATKNMCQQYNATFIIDDQVEIAQQIKADGVHLGKNDMSIAKARKILGKEFIIGGTANTFKEVKELYRDGVDYIGCGPYQYTTTKKKLSPILGLKGYTDILSSMQDNGIDLPVVAIGGITLKDIPKLMKTGISGIALSGSVLHAENPINEMNKIINTIEKWKNL